MFVLFGVHLLASPPRRKLEDMDVLLCKNILNELTMGLAGTADVKGVEGRGERGGGANSKCLQMPLIKIPSCNHCVECCNPGLPTKRASIAYMNFFVHHGFQNSPSKSMSLVSLACPSKYAYRKKKLSLPREDFVDFEPSRLRGRRNLPSLKFLELPQSYTNIPDFYSDLLVVQYEIKRESPKSALAFSSSSRMAGESSFREKEQTSRFKVLSKEEADGDEHLAMKGGQLKLKRPYGDIVGEESDSCYNCNEEDYYHTTKVTRNLSAASTVSSLSSEFHFDGFSDMQDCEFERLPPKIRFKNILTSYRRLGQMIGMSKGIASQSQDDLDLESGRSLCY